MSGAPIATLGPRSRARDTGSCDPPEDSARMLAQSDGAAPARPSVRFDLTQTRSRPHRPQPISDRDQHTLPRSCNCLYAPARCCWLRSPPDTGSLHRALTLPIRMRARGESPGIACSRRIRPSTSFAGHPVPLCRRRHPSSLRRRRQSRHRRCPRGADPPCSARKAKSPRAWTPGTKPRLQRPAALLRIESPVWAQLRPPELPLI